MEEGTAANNGPAIRQRIGINAHLLAQDEGYRRAGVSRYIENLLRGLQREDPEGYYTVFSRGRGSPSSFLLSNLAPGWSIKYSRLPTHSPWARVIWEQCLLPFEIKTNGNLDLLHSPVNVQPLVLPCKSITTVTDLSFMVFPSSFRDFQRFYQRLFTRLSARRATHLIAISQQTAKDVTTFFGVPAKRISITYPGVDDRFRPVRDVALVQEFRRCHNLPEHFFLFVGTLEPRKNLLTLLQAYAAFKRRGRTEHKLVLGGGKGWLYGPLFARVEELGLQGDVLFPGFIPEDDLPMWYNMADAFVYPSLYEGFGLPPLEAMSCGVPVVASNASSLPEVIADAGWLVDPQDVDAWTDALLRVCTDAEWRAELATRGLKRSQEFTWDRMAHETMQVYQKVLAGGA